MSEAGRTRTGIRSWFRLALWVSLMPALALLLYLVSR